MAEIKFTIMMSKKYWPPEKEKEISLPWYSVFRKKKKGKGKKKVGDAGRRWPSSRMWVSPTPTNILWDALRMHLQVKVFT